MGDFLAVIGVLMLSIGTLWLYIKAADDKYNLLYLTEFLITMPFFIIRHWQDVKHPAIVMLFGILLTLIGYSTK